jgi:hypothetical protein
MNKHPIVLGLGVLLLFSACRKNDLQSNATAEVPEVIARSSASLTSWRTVTNWNKSESESQSGHDVKFHDSRIDPDVIQNGLVLVYLKKDNNINALPFTESGKALINWNYQVSENTVQVNTDAASEADLSKAQILYFILSSEKLGSLEQAGHSKIEVITFSYEKAAQLLN